MPVYLVLAEHESETPYSVKQLDLPAPTMPGQAPRLFDPTYENRQMVAQVNSLLSRDDSSPVYMIFDLAQFKMSLNELMFGLAAVAASNAYVNRSVLFNNRVKIILVGTSKLIGSTSRRARQDQYGCRPSQYFNTLDEAMESISQPQPA